MARNKTAAPVLPRDGRLVALLLASAGAVDCEEGVVRMLVEFAHRYTSDILSDSLLYAEHARTPAAIAAGLPLVPSIDDIRLAVQARTDGASVPKEFLLSLASTVNSAPLPPVPEVYGIRLPPVASRITAPNFSLVPRSQVEPEIVTELASAESDSGEGIFGDDNDEEEEEEEESGSGDDDDDEEMEDVTAGMGGGGTASGSHSNVKRKANELDDESYD